MGELINVELDQPIALEKRQVGRHARSESKEDRR
jgi:hypothetical protein